MTSIIENKLYLGSICEYPHDINITCIINVSGEKCKTQNKLCRQINITNLDDSPDVEIDQLFDYVYDIIEKEQCVYIYCLAGISRSPTLVASYLMRKYSIGCDEALDYIRERRPQIQPNEGFMNKLQVF